MPEGFWFTALESPIWVPLNIAALPPDDSLAVMVRRNANVTHEALAERLHAGLAQYTATLPQPERSLRVQAVAVIGSPLTEQIGPYVLWLIGAAVFLTLLIACTNVAVLVIAQWTSREREIAIRAALGAGRSRVVRLLLTESVLIAICGGTLAIAAAFAIRGFLLSNESGGGNYFDAGIRPSIFLQAAAITLLTGVAAGLAPALYETRTLHTNPLRLIPTDRVRQRWRHALVVLEITVTVALLVVTGAIISGYQRHTSAGMGYDPAPLVSARVESDGGVRVSEIVDHLKGLPGVAAVAASNAAPMGSGMTDGPVSTNAAGSNSIVSQRAIIGPEFFAAMNVPLIHGRSFSNQNGRSAPRTTVVNELLGSRLFSLSDPMGRSIWVDGVDYQIIGIVKSYSILPLQRPRPALFLPLPPETGDIKRMQFLLRVTGDPGAIVPVVRDEIRKIAPNHTVPAASSVQEVINVGGREILTVVYLLAPLIAIGMVLTAAGIYSVLAFAVTRRSKELAVRTAIGATGKDLVRLVTRHSVRLVAAGTLLGVGVTFALTRFAHGMGGVFDSPGWQAFIVPVIIVAVVAALATWIPSRRALAIDPAQLLRTD
jgi:predicted permease